MIKDEILCGGGPSLDYQKLLALSGELGYHLLASGAEIYRVEDSINYLLTAYGLPGAEVFAIPNCVFVGLTTPDLTPLTCVRRVHNRGTDIRKMESINQVCRRLCRETPDLDQAWEELEAVTTPLPFFTPYQKALAYGLGTGSFCIFFGGDGWDALVCTLCGILAGLVLAFLGRVGSNLFFKTIAGGFACTGLAALSVAFGIGHHLDKIIIGSLMALAPGLVMTNFMRDIMGDDMMSGLSKLADALLTGAGMALGSGLALSLARMLGGGL